MRWRILFLLFVARVSLGFQFQTLASTGDYLVQAFGLDYTQVGTLIGLFMLPGLFLAIPFGFAGRYASDKILIAVGLLLLCLGGMVVATADGFTQIALGRLICGAGFVFATIYFTKMTSEWFAGKEIATALGVLVMSWPFGIAMGQIVHEYLAESTGWPSAFWTASVVCGIGAAATLAFYRPPGDLPARSAKIDLLSRREVLLIVIASMPWAFFNAGYVVYLSFAPKILTAGGFGALEAVTVLSLASWVMIFSGAVGGQIADRTGKPDLVLYVCMSAAIAIMILLPNTDYSILLALAFGLLGMAPAGVIMALTGDAMTPQRRALGMGLFFSSYFLIVAPTPGIAGWLFDRSGDAYDAILFAALLFALAALGNFAFRLVRAALGPPV